MLATLIAVALVNPGYTEVNWTVDGVDRKAYVFKSSVTNKPTPIVFCWHGFTGGGRQAAIGYRVHESWPEATVVYPQGLEVHLLGKSGPGWQIAPNAQGDRDLKFFDAMLAKMKTDYNADSKRIYTCGMSNGAIFSYVLLSQRGSIFAAAAPVAGIAPRAFKGAPAVPILITHGTKDPLLPFTGAERSRDMAIANNGVGQTQKEWAPGYMQYTPAPKGNDVIWHTHDGGHEWPAGTTDNIVKFFKAHAKS